MTSALKPGDRVIHALSDTVGTLKKLGNRPNRDFAQVLEDGDTETTAWAPEHMELFTGTTTYYIDLQGCDDGTAITMELTEVEAALIEKLAAKTRHYSHIDCMPTMTIRDRPNGSADTYDVESEEF